MTPDFFIDVNGSLDVLQQARFMTWWSRGAGIAHCSRHQHSPSVMHEVICKEEVNHGRQFQLAKPAGEQNSSISAVSARLRFLTSGYSVALLVQ